MSEQKAVITYGGIIEIDQGKLEEAFKKPDGLNNVLKKAREAIEADKAKLPEDLSIGKNRAAYKSLGAEVGKLKAGLEKTAKYLADTKRSTIQTVQDEINIINGVKKKVSEELKELRLEMTAPAVEWEEKEKARKAKIKERIDSIARHSPPRCPGILTEKYIIDSIKAHELKGAIDELKQYEVSLLFFQEFTEEAKDAKKHRLTELENLFLRKEKEEAEAARLEKEKADKEERERKEREEKIRQDAKEKERKEADEARIREKLKREEAEKSRQRLLLKSVQEIRDMGNNIEKLNSEALKARLDILLGIEINTNSFGEFCDTARIAQTETKEKLEKILPEVLGREKEEKEAAAAEALRIEKEKEAKAARKRKADKDHRSKINDAAIKDMVGLGFDKAIAIKLIFHIQSEEIRNLFIRY
jgi:hypothetical protein